MHAVDQAKHSFFESNWLEISVQISRSESTLNNEKNVSLFTRLHICTIQQDESSASHRPTYSKLV